MNDTHSEARDAITQWLTLLARVCRNNGGVQGYTYFGVGDFLLQHAQWYTPRPLPEGVERGAPKNCHANSLLFGRVYGYRYVEGYAVPDIDCILPTHPGWNIDRDGNLLDTTWDKPGLAYFGVEFSLGRAENAIWFDDGSVLDNLHSKFALFRDPWKGENFNLAWRRSNKFRRAVGEIRRQRRLEAEYS